MQNVFEKTLVEDKELPWEIVGDKVKRKIMSYSKDLMLVKVAFEKGGIGAVHKHPHLQISYIANGVFALLGVLNKSTGLTINVDGGIPEAFVR